MSIIKKSAFALATSLLFAVLFALAACGTQSGGGSNTSEGTSAAPATADTSAATSADVAASGELMGKPWVMSSISGNLPPETPDAKDDLYTHYNYEFLAEHQGEEASSVGMHTNDLRNAIIAIIQDNSQAGHDLEQLRIFYNQAADEDALKAIGYSEIQTYLDKVDAVSSIEDFNALMVDKDFPFTPFIQSTITTAGTHDNNIVKVNANLIYTDAEKNGGEYYQDSDDEQTQKTRLTMLQAQQSLLIIDLLAMGMSQEDAKEFSEQVLAFEKTYGQHVDYESRYTSMDYGSFAQAIFDEVCTYDDLIAMCPNIPLEGILGKLGKLGSEKYRVTKAWLEALNDVWTEENLDNMKHIAKATLITEARPYLDKSATNAIMAQFGSPEEDTSGAAYTACDSLNTFSQVMAKLYADNVIGEEGKDRLTALAQNLLTEYKGLFNATTWMSDETKANVIEKLDNLALNILEPAEGYFDYSSLELTATEDGGTLLSNYFKLKQYRYDCESKLINQPACKGIVFYNRPPTILNATYSEKNNSINIYPGWVNSLTYNNDMTDEELYSTAGSVIGHEISHGFDFNGSQFNAYGENNSVYAGGDLKSFLDKTDKITAYYNAIEVMPGTNINGTLVVCEAQADLSGMQAVMALAAKNADFDYDRFFAYISKLYAAVYTDQTLPLHLADVHPLNILRVNVNAQMFQQVYDAFGISEGDGMYLAPENRIVTWGPDA